MTSRCDDDNRSQLIEMTDSNTPVNHMVRCTDVSLPCASPHLETPHQQKPVRPYQRGASAFISFLRLCDEAQNFETLRVSLDHH